MGVNNRRIRVKLNQETKLSNPVTDYIRGGTPETWVANSTTFQFAVFEGADVSSLDDVQSVNVKIRPSQTDDSVALADKTIPSTELNLALTSAEWIDGSGEHGELVFSNAEMNLDISDDACKSFWIVFTAILTGGEEVTLGGGEITFLEDNNVAADPPPENPGTALTLEQGDSRYLQQGEDIEEAPIDGTTYGRKNEAWEGVYSQTEADTAFDPSGSAGGVQTNLDNHIGDSLNPHSVTAEQIGAASGAQTSFALAKTSSRLADMQSSVYNGTQRNALTWLSLGDSLGTRVLDVTKSPLISQIGRCGLGLESLLYKTISGTVVEPPVNTQRRVDVWGTGMVRQLQAGAVMQIADIIGGATIVPMYADHANIYLVGEAGGGTVDIEISHDDGTTWSVLESGVDTDQVTTGLIIKSYSFTYKLSILRLTATSGNVELIGAVMWANKSSGALIAESATGGNPLSNMVNANQSIFQGVLADLAPDLITSHMYEDTQEVIDNFDTYADQIDAAASESDHVWFAEHEKDATGDKEANNNPIYRAKAETLPRLQVWETGLYFGSYDNLVDLGWNSSDAIHLNNDAWRLQGSKLFENFGFEANGSRQDMVAELQEGSRIEYVSAPPMNRRHERISHTYLGDKESQHDFRFGWDDEDLGLRRYWQFSRLSATDANLPSGFTLTRYNPSFSPCVQWKNDGKMLVTPQTAIKNSTEFRARLVAQEYTASVPTIAGDHLSTSTGAVSFAAMQQGVTNARIYASGKGEFKKLTASSNDGSEVDEVLTYSEGDNRYLEVTSGTVNDDTEFAGKLTATGNDGTDEDEVLTYDEAYSIFPRPHNIARFLAADSVEAYKTATSGTESTTSSIGMIGLRAGKNDTTGHVIRRFAGTIGPDYAYLLRDTSALDVSVGLTLNLRQSGGSDFDGTVFGMQLATRNDGQSVVEVGTTRLVTDQVSPNDKGYGFELFFTSASSNDLTARIFYSDGAGAGVVWSADIPASVLGNSFAQYVLILTYEKATGVIALKYVDANNRVMTLGTHTHPAKSLPAFYCAGDVYSKAVGGVDSAPQTTWTVRNLWATSTLID